MYVCLEIQSQVSSKLLIYKHRYYVYIYIIVYIYYIIMLRKLLTLYMSNKNDSYVTQMMHTTALECNYYSIYIYIYIYIYNIHTPFPAPRFTSERIPSSNVSTAATRIPGFQSSERYTHRERSNSDSCSIEPKIWII